MKLVILESPYGNEDPKIVEKNLDYARACLHDCLLRNEAPYASHLLYTQPGVLDDNKPEERKLGIDAGLAFKVVITTTVVYRDLGVTRGMQLGIERARALGHEVEYRSIIEAHVSTIPQKESK